MITPQYLAGLIDGEGYLGLLPSKVKGLKNQSFEPVIKICLTGKSGYLVIKKLQEQFGGTMESRKIQKGKRQPWTWALKSRRKVKDFLLPIETHMLVKQDQANVLIQFCGLPNTHSNYKSFDPEIVNRKVELYHFLKYLKTAQPLATTK